VDAPRITLADTPDFDLGGLRVSPGRRQVHMGDERRDLEPKVALVLVALASARPGVVSRDRLIEECWGGRIVGDDALNRCIVALRHLAKEFSPEPFAIETVPRVGYCLLERATAGRAASRFTRKKIALAALLALLLVAGAGTFTWSRFGQTEAAPASIAVLPFRNLSAGNPYFAEGIGEEILGQLSHEPQFLVAGRVSSSQFGNDPDVRQAARRLNVDYVVEGSVRTEGDRVRVDADLIRARDSIRLWSGSYDGKLDDIFAIQRQIGGSIAGALQRKLLRAPALSGPLVTKGEAYNLYLTARGLIRTRNRHVTATAADLLHDALNMDPGYAPAWASLAEAALLEDSPDPDDPDESRIAALLKAQGYARHALQLAPDLADAHRVLGLVLIEGSPEAQAHIRRAAQLDPSSAENMIALGEALANEGKFDQELAAYKRAGELDPLWFRTTGAQGIALARRGSRADAESVARRGLAKDINNQHILLGRIAWILGDYSEAARQWSIVARANSPRWSFRAGEDVANTMAALGLAKLPPVRAGMALQARLSIEPPPSLGSWQRHNRNLTAADVHGDENQVAAKQMLKTGHAGDLAAAYDSSVGLLGIRRGQPARVDQLEQAPIVALALRQAGRAVEADRLLRGAEASVQSAYRNNRSVPFHFDAEAAAIWAAEGRTEQALLALERAFNRGWIHASSSDLPDIADEPAFRSLHGQPRFERLRARLAAHYATERAETIRLQI
jgi:TolB-like protein/DNA-binding winged helix-turn-helix (wHTH) protein/tetratricopeptide (TPR) repeat protein